MAKNSGRQKTKAPMVYANGRMDNPLDHSHGLAKAAHKTTAVDLLFMPVLRVCKALTVTSTLWRGSLLPLGREAAPSLQKGRGLLRSPAGASSLATGVSWFD
ncbi:hypothetical protein BK670_07445 [Pseudomonas fluorescens]|uniref:Uncharacterized protein n=1 Tax=Pseudomonas fluorescens TaxID=294 RepID=A0A423MI06_PSEFL|nr:hypothetical protein BK670_07445 [Pseudomonas fluorescens]